MTAIRRSILSRVIGLAALGALAVAMPALAADKVVIGHPACLSGKFSKAGEQAVGSIAIRPDGIWRT